MSEVEREALREMEWEEEHRRIMEEADQDLEENERIKEMLGQDSGVLSSPLIVPFYIFS